MPSQNIPQAKSISFKDPIPIEVNARILRHISRGIYRTPAGALKELISNAYDAGARKVTINTGYPIFEKIVVTDNGKGMSLEDFAKFITNIGLSNKIAGIEFKIPDSGAKRNTIGHYGIGIMAIGQLSKQVVITSKTENSLTGFMAEIDFGQFERPIKDEDEIDRAKVESESDIEEKDKKIKLKTDINGNPISDDATKFRIGKCKVTILNYSKDNEKEHFTRFELLEVRSFVKRKLSGNFLEEEYEGLIPKREYYANFAELLKLFTREEEDIKKGQYPYEKLCWELANYSPLKYPDLKIFQKGEMLYYFKKLADAYDFEVVIDGMELYKPIESSFLDDPIYPIRNIFVWENEPYYKGKKVSGYLIYRQHIRPKCIQGILLREEGVAVGMNNSTFLEYPYHEATKFEQLTGELFIEGLSGALNIDRNSFNETDDYYLSLVKWFHNKLHSKVFPEIQKTMKSKREDVSEVLTKLFSEYCEKFNENYKVKFEDIGKGKNLFQTEANVLYINKNHPLGKPNKTSIEKMLLASLLVVSHVVSEKNMEEILINMKKLKKNNKI